MKRLSVLALVAFAACNAPPTAPTVSVSPANPKTDADLKANLVAPSTDPQGDAVAYTYAWLKDGAPQSDLAGDTVPAAKTAKGEVWSVVVTPSDGKLNGPSAQAQATIANTPPTATVAFQPVDPAKGIPLKVGATGSDADGDTVSFTYAWTKDGTSTSFITDTIPAAQLARGQAWQVTVTPNDGTENGTPVSGSVVVGNAKPVVASVTLSPGSPTKATALAAQPTAPSDEDGDVVTLKYAWAVNGTVVDGQSSPSLATTFFQKGQVVTVTVTPNDGKEDGGAVSANVTVGNSEPTAPVPAINARPKDSDDITCTLVVQGTDLDTADTLTHAFTWTRNGQPFSGASSQATSSVISASLTAEGDVFACSVSVTDGTATTSGAASATTTVNAKPVVTSVTLSPSVPTKANIVSAQPTAPSDADNDVVTLRYQWLVNGTVVSGQATSSLAPSNFAKGQSVTVIVTPNDGIEDGSPATASVVVGNSAPTAPVASVTSNPGDADDITCTVSVSSADLDAADMVSYLFNWTRNGQAFSGASVQGTSSTIAASLTADGDVFACTVSATDGTATTVGNTGSSTVRDSYPSCKAALTANPAATDGLYAIDPDGAGPIASVPAFCDMTNGGWTLVANIYDSAGDDAPNVTDFVVTGWQQTASGQWASSATKVEKNSSGTGSSAVSLAFVAALKASAGQQNLKMCFVHQNGTDTECRTSANGTMTLVSYSTGNPKLTAYFGNVLTYTFGRLAGLAGSADAYNPDQYILGYGIPKARGVLFDYMFGAVQNPIDGEAMVDYPSGGWQGVWHQHGGGASYRPWATNNNELGAGGSNGEQVPDPSVLSYGFRLYVGP